MKLANYTTEVRTICENYAGYSHLSGGASVSDIIEKSREKIFDFNFPMFDEKYRSVLETKILKHFYTREIGLETVGLWKLKLDTKLNEIMPYYNQLYKSTLLEFNPFYDVDITRKHNTKSDGTRNDTNENIMQTTSQNTNVVNGNSSSNTSSNENGTNWNLYSDTPQGGVSGIESETYLTNATKDTNLSDRNTNTSTNESSTNNANGSTSESYNGKVDSVIKNVEDYLETVKGKQGTQDYSTLLLKYRETFLNIDMQILEELNELFFNLW